MNTHHEPLLAGIAPLPFKGSDYVAELDAKRLTGQILRVKQAMSDGKYRTLSELEAITGDPQSSISAQIRNLKKRPFGSHQVEKRRRGNPGNGCWEYRFVMEMELAK